MIEEPIEDNELLDNPSKEIILPEDFSDDILAQVESVLTGEKSAEEANAENPPQAEFAMGLTPMGTVGIRITDEEGNSVQYHISDPTEMWQYAGHMQSLATLMVQARYALAMQEQRMIEEMMKKQPIHIPGHGMIG